MPCLQVARRERCNLLQSERHACHVLLDFLSPVRHLILSRRRRPRSGESRIRGRLWRPRIKGRPRCRGKPAAAILTPCAEEGVAAAGREAPASLSELCVGRHGVAGQVVVLEACHPIPFPKGLLQGRGLRLENQQRVPPISAGERLRSEYDAKRLRKCNKPIEKIRGSDPKETHLNFMQHETFLREAAYFFKPAAPATASRMPPQPPGGEHLRPYRARGSGARLQAMANSGRPAC